ncbi:MAG TPA: phospholipase D-like domain-containing protein [Pseudonocardiaceae bacterium]|jgi:phosphatidylserine/phosphatidylglycerophosphate/cardiolipin synthase-like enzyme|nr:phospholipase D-like domain-containing protein [Pseudonocardiaceae bacterium]
MKSARLLVIPALLSIVAAGGATAAGNAANGQRATPDATGTYTLTTLPDQGESSIYDFIQSATSSIDMTMYELRDTTVTGDLVAKEKAGVKVRVILDAKETSVNSTAYNALQSGGVAVTYSSSAFTYTHQKTITVDNAKSYVSTGNLDTKYYSTSRDFGVLDTDANDVAAIEQVFAADFAKTSITPGDGDDLVWSPTDSQTQLLKLINGATTSLDVEQEEFGDTTLVNAVVAAAKRGVAVRVVAEDESGDYDSELNEVTAAGGKVTTYSSSTGYYIHAKTITVDYGTSAAKVFAGSENFSDNSLNHNRELGLIVSDSGILTGIEQAFTADFNKTSGS